MKKPEKRLSDFSNIKLTYDLVKHLKEAKANFKWNNAGIMKDPMSLLIYLQLFQDLKPKTIIEIGTLRGGFAEFCKDICCGALGLDTRVIAIDRKNETKNLMNRDDIEFVHCAIEDMDTYDLGKLEHPILISEDSHKNMKGVLDFAERVLEKGDYLFVEDTINKQKYHELFEMIDHDKYEIDRKYCDLWGRNLSWQYDSIFKRV